MIVWSTYLFGLIPIVGIAVATWAISLWKRDVSIVDSVWSLLLLAVGATYVWQSGVLGVREWLLLALLATWALRLTIYITVRNWGEPEDHRYRQIRARNQPHFAFKSLYIVFLLQGLLAWIVSMPLFAAIAADTRLQWLDYFGAAITTFGIVFEAVGDWQLSRFKADPSNRGKVMDRGLWRYTRHPNYFGECCVWWGFYLIALSVGGWWSVVGPLLMTALLLKVSGVALLEKDIAKRRPEYRRYVEQTKAFVPGRRRDP